MNDRQPGLSGPDIAGSDAAHSFAQEPAYWRELLREYARPRLRPALLALLTSVGGYLATTVAMYLLLSVSVLATLALIPVSTAFLLRSFIVFHDCAHGSFFSSRRANTWVGRACAVMMLVPFANWRHQHNVHHATSGDLDKRGTGDVPTKTLEEYLAGSWRDRLGYRLFRNPFVMFGLGPLMAMIIGPRIPPSGGPRRLRNSVWLTNAGIVVIFAALIWAVGIGDFMLVWAPPALLAGSVGIWLFYVQHQFEDVYWKRGCDWSYADAALRGSSFLRLPGPLAWATGNIGYHHIHHLSARVPFYSLPRTHRELEVFHSVPVLSLIDGLRCVRFKLLDESSGRLITWAELRARRLAEPVPSL
jgi:acyl-lipid omega-6 desaturase (Delta-12 desaturase)